VKAGAEGCGGLRGNDAQLGTYDAAAITVLFSPDRSGAGFLNLFGHLGYTNAVRRLRTYPTACPAARPALPAAAIIAARPGRDRADKPSWPGGEAGVAQTAMWRARRS
jgi:hypothetical protein